MTDFTGKTAFITGGASGLGLAMASAFAARGSRIMLADIDEDRLAEAEKRLVNEGADEGTDIASILCDVSDIEAVRAAAAATCDKFGAVHIVANNAGVGLSGSSGEIPIENWRWIIDVNLMGVINGVETFTPIFKEQGSRAHFINTASMAGHGTLPGLGPYNATKFAVVGYSESLAAELEPANIGVSILCPAWVKTNIHLSDRAKPIGSESPVDTEGVIAFEELANVIENGLDADDVAKWIADCVEADRLYIFTHPSFRPFIEERQRHVMKDYGAIIEDGRFKGR